MVCVSWLRVGDWVEIRTANVEYNKLCWEVTEVDEDGQKAVLKNEDKCIRVDMAKCVPLTLSLRSEAPQIAAHASDITLNAALDLPFHCRFEAYVWGVSSEPSFVDRYLNQWVPIPGLGGNSILLRRRKDPTNHLEDLVLFPRLNDLGLELWFHSAWLGDSVKIIEIDMFKLCPMKQIWPFCAWCGKFHLPTAGSNSHRESKDHAKMRNWLRHVGSETIRSMMKDHWHVEGRWL